MAYTFTVSDVIPATPEAIYSAWLDSRGHSAMTGGKATASAEVGGAFTAWDGYISGRNVQLVPNTRIVQTWRTTKFEPGQQYSIITVLLEPAAGGTRVTLVHANVPDDHKGYEEGGWQTHYFDPMKAYFGRAATPQATPAARAGARPAATAAKAKPAKAAPSKAKAKKAAVGKARAKKKAPAKKAKARVAKAVKRRTAARKAVKRKTAARKTVTRKAAPRPAHAKRRK